MNVCFQRSSLAATAQITNSTNMAKDQWVSFFFSFFFLHFWMQILWFRIIDCTSSVEQTQAVRNATVRSKQPISDKAWKDIAFFLFFLCFTASPFVFSPLPCYAWTAFKQEQDNVGEWCARMALHCSTWGSWDYSLELVYSPIKGGRHSGGVSSAERERERE